MNIRSNKEDKKLSRHFKHITILEDSFQILYLKSVNVHIRVEIHGDYFAQWMEHFGDTIPTRSQFVSWCAKLKLDKKTFDKYTAL